MKSILFFLVLFVNFTSITFANDTLKIFNKKVRFGFESSENRKINSIIVHSTFNNSGGDIYDVDLVLKQFSTYKVSAHYIIARDGKIYSLVDEKNISYHAGKSSLPDGTTNVNLCSIGIELITSYSENPSEEQYKALLKLINNIKSRHKIKYVLRHCDIAPERKTDPWNFDWDNFKKLLD